MRGCFDPYWPMRCQWSVRQWVWWGWWHCNIVPSVHKAVGGLILCWSPTTRPQPSSSVMLTPGPQTPPVVVTIVNIRDIDYVNMVCVCPHFNSASLYLLDPPFIDHDTKFFIFHEKMCQYLEMMVPSNDNDFWTALMYAPVRGDKRIFSDHW